MVGGVSQFQPSNFDFILTLVIMDDDVDLCIELYIDEIGNVVFSIDPNSALGTDGFCSRFYQSY